MHIVLHVGRRKTTSKLARFRATLARQQLGRRRRLLCSRVPDCVHCATTRCPAGGALSQAGLPMRRRRHVTSRFAAMAKDQWRRAGQRWRASRVGLALRTRCLFESPGRSVRLARPSTVRPRIPASRPPFRYVALRCAAAALLKVRPEGFRLRALPLALPHSHSPPSRRPPQSRPVHLIPSHPIPSPSYPVPSHLSIAPPITCNPQRPVSGHRPPLETSLRHRSRALRPSSRRA